MVPDFPVPRSSPHGRVKGTNVHPTPAHFSGPTSDVWVNFWGPGWDWSYVKDSIDLTVTRGVNVFRAIGVTNVVTGGVLTRAQYLARHQQIADYCQAIGIRYYPVGGSLTHRGSASDAAVTAEVTALYQAMVPYGDTILGFDMFNEFQDDPRGLVTAQAMVASTSAAIRGAGSTPIPVTASLGVDIQNPAQIRAITPHVDYLDFHLYLTTAYMQANPTLFGFLQQVAPGYRVVIGEAGINRYGGSTPQKRADFYTAVLAVQAATPQALGTCNWAAVNDQYGLFDYTTRTLQTDIAGAWSLFPTM